MWSIFKESQSVFLTFNSLCITKIFSIKFTNIFIHIDLATFTKYNNYHFYTLIAHFYKFNILSSSRLMKENIYLKSFWLWLLLKIKKFFNVGVKLLEFMLMRLVNKVAGACDMWRTTKVSCHSTFCSIKVELLFLCIAAL